MLSSFALTLYTFQKCGRVQAAFEQIGEIGLHQAFKFLLLRSGRIGAGGVFEAAALKKIYCVFSPNGFAVFQLAYFQPPVVMQRPQSRVKFINALGFMYAQILAHADESRIDFQNPSAAVGDAYAVIYAAYDMSHNASGDLRAGICPERQQHPHGVEHQPSHSKNSESDGHRHRQTIYGR